MDRDNKGKKGKRGKSGKGKKGGKKVNTSSILSSSSDLKINHSSKVSI